MNSRKPSELPKPQTFDYTALDSTTRSLVQRRTSELKRLIRRSAKDTLTIGQNLVEVREQLGYGNFRKWLKAEFAWSHQAATRFIQVAERFSCLNLRQVEIAASALYLLARPSTPEEARQEALERAAQGEVISYALAKQIRSHHTIDVEAEVVEDDEESPTPSQPSPVPEIHSQPEPVNELLSPTTELGILTDTILQPAESQQASEKLESSAQKEPAPVEDFKVGTRIRILRHQHGEDNWRGKTAWIWKITPDGWLGVNVEGHPGVKFTLNSDWVEYMPEVTPEQQNEQPEQVLDEGWADEPDPETPVIAEAPAEVQPEGEAIPQFRTGDRLQVTNLGKSNQQWTGEVAEVVETAEDCIKVIVEIRPA